MAIRALLIVFSVKKYGLNMLGQLIASPHADLTDRVQLPPMTK